MAEAIAAISTTASIITIVGVVGKITSCTLQTARSSTGLLQTHEELEKLTREVRFHQRKLEKLTTSPTTATITADEQTLNGLARRGGRNRTSAQVGCVKESAKGFAESCTDRTDEQAT
jgi:hypothetical protein